MKATWFKWSACLLGMIAVFVGFIGTASAQGVITRRGDASAGAISLVAITRLSPALPLVAQGGIG